jgi:phthalate 4,5-dioxygenase oxygenase subunit
MGAIQDRTREHLGTSDKVIMANRRVLLKAIETVQAGGTPPGVADAEIAAHRMGPDTVDGWRPGRHLAHLVAPRCRPSATAPWDAALTPVAEPLVPSIRRTMSVFAHRCGIHDDAREAAALQPPA